MTTPLPPLLIAAAVSIAVSGPTFAGGSKYLLRGAAAASTTPTSQVTLNDCLMLSVASARVACERSALRGNGGIDSAAVGASSSTSGRGATAGGGAGVSPQPTGPTQSATPIDIPQ